MPEETIQNRSKRPAQTLAPLLHCSNRASLRRIKARRLSPGRALTLLAAGALSLASPLALAQPNTAPAAAAGKETDWAVLNQCAAITEDAVRHACLDAALRARGLMAGPDGAAAPAGPATPMRPPAAQAAEGSPPVNTTIAAAWLALDRRLVVRTSEGQVWRDTGTDRWRRLPEAGDPFSVREGSLGSSHCRAGQWSYRCRLMW